MHFSFKSKQETGRTIVEMLGVLAIIGVLTIGGISGIRYAIDSNHANTIVAELHKRMVALSFAGASTDEATSRKTWKGFWKTPEGDFIMDRYQVTLSQPVGEGPTLSVLDISPGVCNRLKAMTGIPMKLNDEEISVAVCDTKNAAKFDLSLVAFDPEFAGSLVSSGGGSGTHVSAGGGFVVTPGGGSEVSSISGNVVSSTGGEAVSSSSGSEISSSGSEVSSNSGSEVSSGTGNGTMYSSYFMEYPSNEPESCTKQSDCSTGYCRCGTCQDQGDLYDCCEENYQCKGSYRCSGGQCVPRAAQGESCNSKYDCDDTVDLPEESGVVCRKTFGTNYTCTHAKVGDPCSVDNRDSDCPFGSLCLKGICKYPTGALQPWHWVGNMLCKDEMRPDGDIKQVCIDPCNFDVMLDPWCYRRSDVIINKNACVLNRGIPSCSCYARNRCIVYCKEIQDP
ncbi:MAG: hypothetical protein IKS41_00720 [Alphaproteobacteria bacterium]|nr:hypothetical protein [Alphaproteobacteria bacterium]